MRLNSTRRRDTSSGLSLVRPFRKPPQVTDSQLSMSTATTTAESTQPQVDSVNSTKEEEALIKRNLGIDLLPKEGTMSQSQARFVDRRIAELKAEGALDKDIQLEADTLIRTFVRSTLMLNDCFTAATADEWVDRIKGYMSEKI